MRSAQPCGRIREELSAETMYSGAGLGVVADFVVAHLGRDNLFEDREGAAKAAAFVRPGWRDEFDPFDLREQIHWLREEWLVQLGGGGVIEPAQSPAAVVQPDAMRKPGPRKRLDLLDVVQEFDQLECPRPYLLHLRRLLDGVEIVAYVVDAAARWRNDVIEASEVAHEQRLGIGALGIEAAVRHRLPATGLVARV